MSGQSSEQKNGIHYAMPYGEGLDINPVTDPVNFELEAFKDGGGYGHKTRHDLVIALGSDSTMSKESKEAVRRETERMLAERDAGLTEEHTSVAADERYENGPTDGYVNPIAEAAVTEALEQAKNPFAPKGSFKDDLPGTDPNSIDRNTTITRPSALQQRNALNSPRSPEEFRS